MLYAFTRIINPIGSAKHNCEDRSGAYTTFEISEFDGKRVSGKLTVSFSGGKPTDQDLRNGFVEVQKEYSDGLIVLPKNEETACKVELKINRLQTFKEIRPGKYLISLVYASSNNLSSLDIPEYGISVVDEESQKQLLKLHDAEMFGDCLFSNKVVLIVSE